MDRCLWGFLRLGGGVGTMNTMGAFQRHISQYQLHNYSDGDIGWISGIYAFLSYACGLIVGPFLTSIMRDG
jgi:hypothetical protein